MPRHHNRDHAWSYCEPCPSKDGYVSCTLCKGQVSLGPNPKHQSIGAFKKHIKNRHFSLWNELYSVENTETPTSGKKRTRDEEVEEELEETARTKKARKNLFQSTLPEVLESSQPMPFHSEKSLQHCNSWNI